MNFLKNVLKKLIGLFTSGKAERAFNTAVALVPQALPIVEDIAALTPTRADDEIVAAFSKYAVPFSAAWRDVPQSERGYLLLYLATEILRHVRPGTATNILHTAIQFAVTGMKAR